MTRQVIVIGLDCVPPKLLLQRYRGVMPNVSRLLDQGAYGPLRSTVPPITVPAWASMFSGRDPGELGLYGFRSRVRGRYDQRIVDARDLREPMVWDRAGDAGKRVCVLFVPPSYPPRAVRGELVSCFLTPDATSSHTHPPELAAELRARFGDFRPDVEEHRSGDLPALLREVRVFSEQRFAIALHLLQTRNPDLLVMVDVGPDRLHHGAWAHIDPDHPAHVPGGPHEHAGRDYYAWLDTQIGRLVDAAPQAAVLLASDHGARPLLGGVCINEWLIERGYLVLDGYPGEVTPLDRLPVDFSRTRAWGEGGYYGRLFFNLQGREPQGCVRAGEVEALRRELIDGLGTLVPQTRVLSPEQCYRRCEGFPPDLAVFFGDLAYRCIGSVGHGQGRVRVAGNDTGFDTCNHDWDGVFVLHVPGAPPAGPLSGLSIYDVGATVLGLLGVPAPSTLLGRDRSKPA